MFLKEGISVAGIQPELLIALMVCETVFSVYDESFTVTSVTDGEHSLFSYHPGGYAADFRLPRLAKAEFIVADIRKQLGSNFDVVLEDTHIHVEFDVRRFPRQVG